MSKRPETIALWRHWFGRSLRPGKPSNSPRGAEDATMVRRAPFPLSRLPASIEHSTLESHSVLCVSRKVPGGALDGRHGAVQAPGRDRFANGLHTGFALSLHLV